MLARREGPGPDRGALKKGTSMSDFDRNVASGGTFADRRVAIDAGLRAHMIRVYNYMAMAVALTGVVAWSGRQLRMDVIVSMMPARVEKLLALLSELTFIVIAIVFVVFAWPVIRDLWAFDQRSQSAEIPMVIPQVMIPIGLSIMAFLVVMRLITGGDRTSSGPSSH